MRRKGVRWKVDEGDSILIWGDAWLNNDSGFKITTPAVPNFEDMIVKDLFIPDTRQWHYGVISEVFNVVDRERILRTTPAPGPSPDKEIWHYDNKGLYTVKSAYHLAMRIIDDVESYENTNWKVLWRFKVPPKIKVFFWRLCKGWLAVRAKLSRWNLGIPSLCPLCNAMSETVWHLFVDCAHVKECWRELGMWEKVYTLCHIVESPGELFINLVTKLDVDDAEKAMTILWSTWRTRNDMVWNNTVPSVTLTIWSSLTFLREWKEVRNPKQRERSKRCNVWHAPPRGFIKLNVDAGFFSDTWETSVGMVIRDDRGEFVTCRSMLHPGLMRVDEGEAWGVLMALQWIKNLRLSNVVVETDSKLVYDAFARFEKRDTSFGDFIELGREITRTMSSISIKWVSRDANIVAHSIARISRNYGSPFCWVEPPSSVIGLLTRCTSCI